MIAYRYSKPAERKLARAALAEIQAGRCAGCFEIPARLNLDHDHETDLARGLLCHTCNVGEGHGYALAWDGYIARPPATFLGQPAAMHHHWRTCLAEQIDKLDREASEQARASWAHPFYWIAEAAMRDLLNGSEPGSVGALWMLEEHNLYLDVEAAVRNAVTIDMAGLAQFGARPSGRRWLIGAVVDQVAAPLVAEMNRTRKEELAAMLASRTAPHAYVDAGPSNPADFPTVHEYHCGFEGCGLQRDRHPSPGAGSQVTARGVRARSRLQDLEMMAAESAA